MKVDDFLKLEPLEKDLFIVEKIFGSSKPAYGKHMDGHIDPILDGSELWVCLPEYDNGDVCEWKPVKIDWNVIGRLMTIVSIAFDIKIKKRIRMGNSVTLKGHNGGRSYSYSNPNLGIGMLLIICIGLAFGDLEK